MEMVLVHAGLPVCDHELMCVSGSAHTMSCTEQTKACLGREPHAEQILHRRCREEPRRGLSQLSL